jgi:hypothetical protein
VSEDAFVVDTDRRTAAVQAVAFGVLSAGGISIALSGHLAGLLFLLAAPAAWWYGRIVLQGRILLVIDAEGMALFGADCWSGGVTFSPYASRSNKGFSTSIGISSSPSIRDCSRSRHQPPRVVSSMFRWEEFVPRLT